MSRRPHILIFNPDTWRGDVLGHLGNPAAVTPHLDEWVSTDAVSFRHAFCQNPICVPSRCSFMTGWYPHVRGHRTMSHMLRLHHGEPNLLKALKDAGYFVWWGGKNDLVPAQHGFAEYCDVKYQAPRIVHPDLHSRDDWRGAPGSDTWYSFYAGRLDKGDADLYLDPDWATVLGAIEFIQNAPTDRPLCIFLPLLYPHPPYGVEEPYFGMIDRAKLPPRIPTPTDWAGKPSMLRGIHARQNLQSWTEDRWTELRATYYGMCARLDDQFGRVLEALRRAGLYDDTAVFFFSDHGDFTGDYGLVEKTSNTFEDCLTRVPFLIKPPNSVPTRPRVSDALVELVDFPATVYEMTGLVPGYSHFGRSLLPVLAGTTDEHRDAVFCEGGRLRSETFLADRSGRLTDPGGLYWPKVNTEQSPGPESTKAVMCRTRDWKYVRRLYESDELYDLRRDPREQHNCVADPACAAVGTQFRERLLSFYLETADVVPHDHDRRG